MFNIWFLFVAHDVIKYAVAASLAYLIITLCIGRLLPGRRLQARRPELKQMAREVGYSLLTAIIFGSGSLVAIFLPSEQGWNRLYGGSLDGGWAYALFSLSLMIIAHDAYFYWTHRLMHHPKLMRWFHRTHHRSRTPTPWTAYAMDPGEALVQVSFAALFVLLVPVHKLVLLLWSIHMIIRNVIGHSGFELYPSGWLNHPLFGWLTSATHHDLHHETGRQNYGLYFTWWDRLMGTEHADYRRRFAAVTKSNRSADATAAGMAVRNLLGLILFAVLLVGCCKPASATPVLGEWATPGYGARVLLEPCRNDPEIICGNIVWLWEAVDETGAPVKDRFNSDASLREQPLLGRQVMAGFRADGAGRYISGRAYNPEDGRYYNASFKLRAPDALEVKGCVLFLCQTQLWRRVNCPPAQSGG